MAAMIVACCWLVPRPVDDVVRRGAVVVSYEPPPTWVGLVGDVMFSANPELGFHWLNGFHQRDGYLVAFGERPELAWWYFMPSLYLEPPDGVRVATDDDLVVVARMPNVTSLSLRGGNITDHGLAALADMTTLRVLDLSETNITGAGLLALSALDQLQ